MKKYSLKQSFLYSANELGNDLYSFVDFLKNNKLTAKPIDYAAEKANLYIHDIKDF